ncbi:cytochrome P450 [Pyrenochaeta sp. MPI-SDFR-AT-0127]|nr:cytochrome P450 [Pyrenochaeta sp. MPI-SDFR-AT-0127]
MTIYLVLQYPNQIFKLDTSNYETLILPRKYINEIKSIPEEKVSSVMDLHERLLGKYTLIGTDARAHGFVNSIRMDLNKNLVHTLDPLVSESRYAVQQCIGKFEDWTPIHVYPQALRMVSLLSGRIFVGSRLSRKEEWITASIQTTVDTFTGAYILWRVNWLLRPITAFFLPQVRNIHRQNKNIAKLLEPLIEERLSQMEDPSFKRPVDMLQFFLENLTKKDAHYQARLHTAINVAAIHTTSMILTHVLYDLAAYPHHIQPLREEALEALQNSGGIVDKNFLSRLKKMDSFLRESQRFNPPLVVSLTRKVMQDTYLSDGVMLPKGSFIACDSWTATRDAQLWENPESFDGFRFEKLRMVPGNEAKYQFVTTSPDNLAFGHGTYSCPGRFFAANEVKILICDIIQNYDIALQPGCERPPNTYDNTMVLPDRTANLLFRSRLS